MKKKYSRNSIRAPFLALALATGVASAGTTETVTAPVAPAPPADVVSGVLNLDFNSHFVSYGSDVWSDGDSMSEPNFNPMVELSFALPANFTATLGTWWDVNSKNGGDSSPLGGRIQEVDVWGGLGYTIGDFTAKVTYQAWMYAGGTEDILDVTLSYKCFLSPSLTIHNRLDDGGIAGSPGDAGGAGDEGTVLVGAISYSFEAGPVTISFPLNVAFFCTDDYHAPDADTGFGYGSIGATASYPLEFLSAAGNWSIHGGLTYFLTSQDVIPGNIEGDFLTWNAGLTLTF